MVVYIYIQTNKDWNYENKYKFGFTVNPKLRLNTDQHSHKTTYYSLYECCITDNYFIGYKEIDNIIANIGRNHEIINGLEKKFKITLDFLKEIDKYLVNNDGGNEFIYKDGLELLDKLLLIEYPKLGIDVKKLDVIDLNIFNSYIVEQRETDITTELKLKLCIDDEDDDDECDFNIPSSETEEKYELRDYQQKIVDTGFEILNETSCFYLELATGAGKSVIAYSIINLINPSNIIILTPRINICQQNIGNKYLSLLTNKNYKVYNKNNLKQINNSDNNLICCCIQSFKKVYETIKAKDLQEIFIWFDEAHWGINNWIGTSVEMKTFFLHDKMNIKYKLFTSASVDKDEVNEYKKIYGDLYSPIKVKNLIKDHWLCDINAYIYKDDYEIDGNITNPSFITFILGLFKKLDKKLAMSFNKDCHTALVRFKTHLKLFKEDKTDIKPYLLLNNDYIKKLEIDKSFIDINLFNEDKNGIGYVVAQYSMGYDNKNIDMLIFRDPKLSYKDIIQCIGRGTRPDQNNDKGKNLDKINTVVLPVYINSEDDNANNYENIKEILQYLLIDLDLQPQQIFKEGFSKIGKLKTLRLEDCEKDFDFIESCMYDINKNYYKWTIKKLNRHLTENDVHNYNEYQLYKNNNRVLNLPEELFKDLPNFNFHNTYKLNKCPYYSREDCIKAIESYKLDLLYSEDIDNDEDKLLFLNDKDKKIPNECLWYYYGGKQQDFIVF
jgi:superfamily II DNA or RNA helicase